MPAWVIDCSLAAALGLPDESSDKADRFLQSLDTATELWIPPLWWYEINNVLVMAQRRNRISEAQAMRIMALYKRLPLRLDVLGAHQAADTIRELAQRYGLTVYDAAYLELAQRLQAGLATLDKDLEAAAQHSGVTIFQHPA